jgi:hypothetical protein
MREGRQPKAASTPQERQQALRADKKLKELNDAPEKLKGIYRAC